MNKKELQQRRKLLEKEQAILDAAEQKSKKAILVKCESNCYGKGCGAKFTIGRLTYIQTFYYVEPYSCSGGDYWLEDEGMFDCPKCNHRNRLYDRKHIQELRSYFKNEVESHDRSHLPKIDAPRKQSNNDF